jgi:hypothetical protein
MTLDEAKEAVQVAAAERDRVRALLVDARRRAERADAHLNDLLRELARLSNP